MTKEEIELLRQQAIEANNQRIAHLESFLNKLPLNTDENKCVSLELATMIMFIEQDTEKLINL